MLIEVFRSGTTVDALGVKREFTEKELDEMCQYDGEYSIPVVLGHPSTDSPSYGWVKKVMRAGKSLFAFAEPAADLIKLLEEGKYKEVSAALYAPDDQRNPNPGYWSLRHVGFLGAARPAIKGLGVVYSEEQVVEEENENMRAAAMQAREESLVRREMAIGDREDALTEREAAIAAREAELSQREAAIAGRELEIESRLQALQGQIQQVMANAFSERVNAMVTVGKVLPAEVETLASVYKELSSEESREAFWKSLQSRNSLVEFTEQVRPTQSVKPYANRDYRNKE